MNAKRGYVPEDERNFSPEAIEKLKTASRHILYLLDEGYDLKQATVFVGNHFMLSERQRLAIMRSVATSGQVEARKNKRAMLSGRECSGNKADGPVAPEGSGNETGVLSDREVWIDGFNTIITLEVMLSDSLLFECMDGTVRDLAALRGTYRLIPETSEAVKLMFDVLAKAGVGRINILLDEPVSNSGRLKSLIADIAEEGNYAFDLDIQILRDVDRKLYGKECVITSDSIVMDNCKSWIGLTAECMRIKGRHGINVWN